MPEDSGGEKSLPASGQKLQKARDDGNIARSQDLSAGGALMVALLALYLLGPGMMAGILEVGRYYLGNAHLLIPSQMPLTALAAVSINAFARITLPIALVMLATGMAFGLLQVGFLLTSKPLQPKLSRINPITGLQKFVSLRSLVELAKSLAKLALVGVIVYNAMYNRLPDILSLMSLNPWGVLLGTMELTYAVWWRVALAMVAIGILDYGYQFWQRQQDLRMTVQEARQESKELEGDPQIKRRVRQLQRQIAMQRMMADVPTAEVVITNPTHYAIALRYDMDAMKAPVIVAKGARLMAQRIRELAVEHDVPIVQRPELARTLFRTIELGQPVPEHLFRAVAEVLSYVFQIDRREEKKRERAKMVI